MLNYKKINNKMTEWAVLIHGFGGNHKIFKKQIDEYSLKYNLLLIDLHGHGKSKSKALMKVNNPNFKLIGKDIIKVMDYLNIHRAHFIGISLGTMIISSIADAFPNRIISMVLGGAVIKHRLTSKVLIYLGNLLRGIVPYMILYKLFAFIMMPKTNHKKSREIFVREAEKLGKKEFFTWFDLVDKFEGEYPIKKLKNNKIPKLYIMGKEDHMFLKTIKEYVKVDKNSGLHIISDCGHVCNIDKPLEFNKVSLKFLEGISKIESFKRAI